MKTKIGISQKHLKDSSAILSVVLSNEMILYVKTRKAHWNVSGESFMELHKLFEDHYTQLEEAIDLVAERIGKLGHKTIGTMIEFSALATLKEQPNVYSSNKDVIKELLSDQESIIVELRKDIETCMNINKDAGTADFLTGLMEQHETIAWILRRYLD
jgi:starvation-inducible DNA-binding protein